MAQDCVTKTYFAYGSNLWLDQMLRRCPTSPYTSVARLPNYRWLICERGYANIVRSPGDEVWGMLYNLTPPDEASLDGYEGVPQAYTKEMIPVELTNGTSMDALVYIDYNHQIDGTVKEEYIQRMSCAIKDGVGKGIPQSYVQKYMLKPLGLGADIFRPGSSSGSDKCVYPN
ncbi:hypothetical protein TWF730_007564 [Orbilia blumenaviensis]|uniref:gamma-glutamylcyclotransferase n=1 Tax=Orbilia blumenaviensis TaxID=1796055 RepID=A0AAV9V9C0_9PEZI